jgi:hypothetical protein
MDEFQLMETVVATIDIPDEGVLAGDVGTIVDVYTQGATAYEVEFTTAEGTSRAMVTLAPAHIRRLTPTDVLTTRQQPAINRFQPD